MSFYTDSKASARNKLRIIGFWNHQSEIEGFDSNQTFHLKEEATAAVGVETLEGNLIDLVGWNEVAGNSDAMALAKTVARDRFRIAGLDNGEAVADAICGLNRTGELALNRESDFVRATAIGEGCRAAFGKACETTCASVGR
ncbi:MAG: hypothetical protein H7318_01450 [Oligoflexus sp.]|nr:hypothetical protein [Oligoflexus sp.]